MTTTTASRALPWALIGAACLGSFAATSSGTTRAPFLLEMSHDLGVSMPLVANLVSMTATAWGVTSAFGGWLSDRIGRRVLLVGGLFAPGAGHVGQAMAGNFFWVAVWATIGGGCCRHLHRRGLRRGLGPGRGSPARPRARLGDDRPVAHPGGRRAARRLGRLG